MNSVSMPSPIAQVGCRDTTTRKWRTVEDESRSNTTKSNISPVFGLGPAKAASAHFLFATYLIH